MSDELLTLLDGKVIGSVIRVRNGKLAFRYLQAWREAEEAYPLSLSMPLGSEEHDNNAIEAFLWGLYAPYEPTYCTDAVVAIESVMSEVRSHLKRTDIDQPVIDAAALAKEIGDKNRGGIGNQKREEIRFLILTGVPHAEIVNRTGVSSGTVSLVRKEVREAVPLYRNSSSGAR